MNIFKNIYENIYDLKIVIPIIFFLFMKENIFFKFYEKLFICHVFINIGKIHKYYLYSRFYFLLVSF